MGLFEKIKKVTPVVGSVTVAGAAATAGAYASQAFAKDDKVSDDQTSDSATPLANQDPKAPHNSNAVNSEATSFSTPSSTSTIKVEASESQDQVDESPESTYNPETGVTTRHYPNGNILTEYSDGTRAWHDATSKETIVYNPETGESTTYEPDGDVVTKSPDGSQVIVEADGGVIFRDPSGTPTMGQELPGEFPWDCTPLDDATVENNPLNPFAGAVASAGVVETSAQTPSGLFASIAAKSNNSPDVNELLAVAQNGTLDPNSVIQALSNQIGMSPETTQLLNELSTAAQNGTLDPNSVIQALSNQTGMSPETTQLLNELSTAAQNGTLDSTTLIQPLGKQAGIPLEGKVNAAYEEKIGWEANYNKTHTGSDEIAPDVSLASEASYNANVFAGAYSKGDAGAEWNSNQAHLHAHTRSMVGIEASQDASYKGTLNIEGVEHQPGVNANASTRGFAGAELEGQGDAVFSKDAAHASLGGNAFAGAKAEVQANGALSVDGDDFARAEGRAGAWAGVGAEFNVDAGYQDGQFNVGMDMGAAYGVGYGYGYNVSVDAPGIVTHPDAVIESIQGA
jgi:hypothetical protein